MTPPILNVYAWISATRTLGPYLRAALWVQGCPLSCSGCMTPAALPHEGGQQVDIADLTKMLCALPDIEGITISGGEPFAQAQALTTLLTSVHHQRDLGVIVYSGYTLAALRHQALQQPAIDTLLVLTDLLIDGPYLASQNDGLSLRGSANQQIHVLTPRYREVVESYYAKPQRPVEMHMLENEVMLVGVPGNETLKKWQTRIVPLLHKKRSEQ